MKNWRQYETKKKKIKNVLRDLDVSLELVEIEKEISPHHKKLKKTKPAMGEGRKRQQHRQKTDMLAGRRLYLQQEV